MGGRSSGINIWIHRNVNLEHIPSLHSHNTPFKTSTIDHHTPFRRANPPDSPPDYLPIPPSDLDLNDDFLGDSQFSYLAMQSPIDSQDMNDFSMEAIRSLFEPTGGSILSPESSRLIPEQTNSRTHGRNLSTGSASSFMTLFEDPHTSTHTGLPAHLPITRSQSIPGIPSCSQSYERYPKQPPQLRKRANSEDDDHSDDLEPLDPNATDEQKREHKRRQNTLAARRSRARRAQEAQSLREENARLKTENAVWKERALMMERLLATHGVPSPNFST